MSFRCVGGKVREGLRPMIQVGQAGVASFGFLFQTFAHSKKPCVFVIHGGLSV